MQMVLDVYSKEKGKSLLGFDNDTQKHGRVVEILLQNAYCTLGKKKNK